MRLPFTLDRPLVFGKLEPEPGGERLNRDRCAPSPSDEAHDASVLDLIRQLPERQLP